MNQFKKRLLFVLGIFFILGVFVVLTVAAKNLPKPTVKMFNSSEEIFDIQFEVGKLTCETLSENKSNSKLYSYLQCCELTYEFEKSQVIFFGYVFHSKQEAKKFYEELVDKKDFLDNDYLYSVNSKRCFYAVLSNEKVYWLESQDRELLDQFVDKINQTFTIDVYELILEEIGVK